MLSRTRSVSWRIFSFGAKQDAWVEISLNCLSAGFGLRLGNVLSPVDPDNIAFKLASFAVSLTPFGNTITGAPLVSRRSQIYEI